VIFGTTSIADYSYMMFNGRQKLTQLFRVTGGKRELIATSAVAGIPDQDWHDVELINLGDLVLVYLDGIEIINASDPRLATPGYIGFGSYNDSAYFDDFRVSSEIVIPTTPPAAAAVKPEDPVKPLPSRFGISKRVFYLSRDSRVDFNLGFGSTFDGQTEGRHEGQQVRNNEGNFEIEIRNLKGRQVFFQKGKTEKNSLIWDPKVSSGIYFYTLQYSSPLLRRSTKGHLVIVR